MLSGRACKTAHILVSGEMMCTFLTILTALDWGIRLNIKHTLPTSARNFDLACNEKVGTWTGPHNASCIEGRFAVPVSTAKGSDDGCLPS